MAIKYFNIRTGETRTADTEPKITALWASSDHSPNITQGQDFGWRLAPEVVVEMQQIKQNLPILQQIAVTYNRPLEDIGESDILTWISDHTLDEDAPVAEQEDYQSEYEKAIRKLQREQAKKDTEAGAE